MGQWFSESIYEVGTLPCNSGLLGQHSSSYVQGLGTIMPGPHLVDIYGVKQIPAPLTLSQWFPSFAFQLSSQTEEVLWQVKHSLHQLPSQWGVVIWHLSQKCKSSSLGLAIWVKYNNVCWSNVHVVRDANKHNASHMIQGGQLLNCKLLMPWWEEGRMGSLAKQMSIT